MESRPKSLAERVATSASKPGSPAPRSEGLEEKLEHRQIQRDLTWAKRTLQQTSIQLQHRRSSTDPSYRDIGIADYARMEAEQKAVEDYIGRLQGSKVALPRPDLKQVHETAAIEANARMMEMMNESEATKARIHARRQERAWGNRAHIPQPPTPKENDPQLKALNDKLMDQMGKRMDLQPGTKSYDQAIKAEQKAAGDVKRYEERVAKEQIQKKPPLIRRLIQNVKAEIKSRREYQALAKNPEVKPREARTLREIAQDEKFHKRQLGNMIEKRGFDRNITSAGAQDELKPEITELASRFNVDVVNENFVQATKLSRATTSRGARKAFRTRLGLFRKAGLSRHDARNAAGEVMKRSQLKHGIKESNKPSRTPWFNKLMTHKASGMDSKEAAEAATRSMVGASQQPRAKSNGGKAKKSSSGSSGASRPVR